MSVQSSLVMHPIYAYGNGRAAHEVPAQARDGEWVGCFGLTGARPRFRSGRHEDARRHRARRLQCLASKMWITNSPIADVLVVWAKLDGGAIRGFILSAAGRASQTPKIEGKIQPARLGHRRHHARRGVRPGREPAAQRRRPGRTVRLPEQRPLRHRLGRHGRCRVLLEAGTQLRSTASSSAGRSPPTSSSRRSSPTCRPRSRSACRPACGSAGSGSRAMPSPR